MTEMPQPPLIATNLSDGVATLTLGGGKAHPLSLEMIRSLHAALDAAESDPDVRVIVIHGPGPIFCAGHDLKEIARHRADPDAGRAFLEKLFAACADLMQAVAACPKPTIAMVEGIATAAGLQLTAACDLTFASDDARFQLPGVNNGGFCTTPAVAVSRAISRKHLMELLLSGEVFDADWALNAGLVNRVFAPEELAEATRDFARTLAGRNPGPIATGKGTLNAHADLPLSEAYALANETMVGHFMDPARLEREKQSRFSEG